MLIAITIISILVMTGLARLMNRALPFMVCPICAGVAGTWLGLIAAKFLGYGIDLIVPAILMGGSVVGIAYQLEKRFASHRSLLLWKAVFISAGFAAAFGLVTSRWTLFFIAAAILVLSTAMFGNGSGAPAMGGDTRLRRARKQAVAELEKNMENCC